MKKRKNVFWRTVSLLFLALIVLGIICFFWLNRMPSSNLSQEEQVLALLQKGGCAACHQAGEKAPFYASWPVAGKMVSRDIEKGLRFFNVTPVLKALKEGKPVDEISLSMLEFVVENRTMAPMTYYAIHWSAYTTAKEQSLLLDWIKKVRTSHYTSGLAAPEFAQEPISPMIDSLPVDPSKVELGFMLFHDTRLSADNTISCASCHDIQSGGVDHKQFSEGVGGQFGGVNAPTVFNSVFNFVQFWDGRAADLAEQAAGPPMNPIEMACKSWDEVVVKLNKDPEIKKRFSALYADGITGTNITNAIAEYERTLITPNSRFDLYLKGNKNALTPKEIEGYMAFKDFRCATCHAGVNMGGKSYEYMGMSADYFADRHARFQMGLTEEDNGRYKQTKQENDRHRFKVPGLRNIAVTSPYYHDGTRKTTKEAVRDMLTYQVGLPFTEVDVDKIDLFLQTLTGKYQGQTLVVRPEKAAAVISQAN